jgi:DNA-directed RNA polymerase subunit RPC12/RpoP
MSNEVKVVRLSKGQEVVRVFCPSCGPQEPYTAEDFDKHVVFLVKPDRTKALRCPKCETRFNVLVR